MKCWSEGRFFTLFSHRFPAPQFSTDLPPPIPPIFPPLPRMLPPSPRKSEKWKYVMENLGTKTQFQIQLSLKQPFQQSTEQSCDQTNGKYFNLKDVKFLKKTTGIVVKSNKCNQCDYASSHAGHLKTHLKTHSGEKSNKCNQCGRLCLYSGRHFEDTYKNAQWRKITQMQAMWICLFSGRHFEETL